MDTLVEKFAEEYEIPIEVMKPDYTKYGENYAPLKRNDDMVKEADYGVAFWNGASKGTLYTITELAKAGKQCIVIGVKRC